MSNFEFKELENAAKMYARVHEKSKVNLTLAQQVVGYFNAKESTTRATAKYFKIAHSTVYRYLTEVIPNERSLEILARNKAESASRGGRAAAIARKRKQSL